MSEACPKKVSLRLCRARRAYVLRLLAVGLYGNDVEEVVDRMFSRGLQELVPPEWQREAIENLRP